MAGCVGLGIPRNPDYNSGDQAGVGYFQRAILNGKRVSAYRAFLQWIADGQLAEAAGHRNLYGDLALGCAFDGGELAADPTAFAAGVSIGAPPDPFSAAGQVWNLPPFSPIALNALGLEPMRRVIAANMRHAAALRIDHVLGFARQFWVPRGGEGREARAFLKEPQMRKLAVQSLNTNIVLPEMPPMDLMDFSN